MRKFLLVPCASLAMAACDGNESPEPVYTGSTGVVVPTECTDIMILKNINGCGDEGTDTHE